MRHCPETSASSHEDSPRLSLHNLFSRVHSQISIMTYLDNGSRVCTSSTQTGTTAIYYDTHETPTCIHSHHWIIVLSHFSRKDSFEQTQGLMDFLTLSKSQLELLFLLVCFSSNERCLPLCSTTALTQIFGRKRKVFSCTV